MFNNLNSGSLKLNQLSELHQYQCNRCNTVVDLDKSKVSEGYFAYCPTHDEDLYKFECTKKDVEKKSD